MPLTRGGLTNVDLICLWVVEINNTWSMRSDLGLLDRLDGATIYENTQAQYDGTVSVLGEWCQLRHSLIDL